MLSLAKTDEHPTDESGDVPAKAQFWAKFFRVARNFWLLYLHGGHN